ncbi:hypothetical protein [Desulfobacula sp.]|uniref:hypothetical protein n=1 Tax=Desulfobacula sp. TaxID=2593537 RepID=UPI00260D0CBC|nr:hypothetical protein [Desulfobacula sp.]
MIKKQYRPISREVAEKMSGYIKAGASYRETSKAYGRTIFAIKTAFEAHKIKIDDIYKNRTSVSDAAVKKAVGMLESGETQQRTAEVLGIHVITLKRAFRIKGIKKDPAWGKGRLSKQQDARARALFKNGLSYGQVSIDLGISKISLYSHFKKIPKPCFEMSKRERAELKLLLTMGTDRKVIAEKLETTDWFVLYATVKLGLEDYFNSLEKWDARNNLTQGMIEEIINRKFKGETTGALIKEFKTTKPTLYRLFYLIEEDCIKRLKD